MSWKSLLTNMTSMMAALHTRMDTMEDGGKKRKVVFHGDPAARSVIVSGTELRAPPGFQALSTSQKRPEMVPVGSVPSLLPSTSHRRPEMTPTLAAYLHASPPPVRRDR